MIQSNSEMNIAPTPTLGASSSKVEMEPKRRNSESKSRDSYGPEYNMTRLDATFAPGAFDVICARGSKAKVHVGNINFRKKVAERAEDYASAKSKDIKSLIVSSIMEWVREKSPAGGFVKQIDGEWYEVGDMIAREKIGQGLRENNHYKYKSSMKAKRMRWKKQKQDQKTCRDGDMVLTTMLKDHYEAVETKWLVFGSRTTDDQMLGLFTQQNRCLLQAVKSDDFLQEHIHRLV